MILPQEIFDDANISHCRLMLFRKDKSSKSERFKYCLIGQGHLDEETVYLVHAKVDQVTVSDIHKL